MNKMLVAVFDSETQAFEGLSALKELHSEGSISLYGTGVVSKGDDGKVEVKDSRDRGGKGTITGMAVGGLLGFLAGPVGVVVGVTAGTMVGIIADLRHAGISVEFVEEVSEALVNGKTAVIAEVDEEWVTPVDTRLGDHNAMIYRRLRREVIDDQLDREREEFNQELAELKQELKEANDERKEKLNARVDRAKEKLATNKQLVIARIEAIEKESKEKMDAIEEQMKTASDKRKSKLEKRRKELKADYAKRVEKLEKAWGLTKEALG